MKAILTALIIMPFIALAQPKAPMKVKVKDDKPVACKGICCVKNLSDALKKRHHCQ